MEKIILIFDKKCSVMGYRYDEKNDSIDFVDNRKSSMHITACLLGLHPILMQRIDCCTNLHTHSENTQSICIAKIK